MLLKKSVSLLRIRNPANSFLKWSKYDSLSRSRYFCSATDNIEHEPVKKSKLSKGPGLKEFLIAGKNLPINPSITTENVPYLNVKDYSGNGRKVYFEVYGCQMNVNDTEVVWSILKENDFVKVDEIKQADVILIVTCAIREGAEAKVSWIICSCCMISKRFYFLRYGRDW